MYTVARSHSSVDAWPMGQAENHFSRGLMREKFAGLGNEIAIGSCGKGSDNTG